jgi:hypothetical protein
MGLWPRQEYAWEDSPVTAGHWIGLSLRGARMGECREPP